MGDHPDGSLAAFWERLKRSPVRWLVLVHVTLLGIALVQLTVTSSLEMSWVLVASLVMAQLTLLMTGTTLNERTRKSRLMAVWYLVPLATFSSFVGAPAWLLGLASPIGFTFLSLMALGSKGWHLRHFERATMPQPCDFQFSIRSALLITVSVSLLFGLKGVVAMLESWQVPNLADLGSALVIVAMIVIILTICVCAPLVTIWAVLTPGRSLPRLATVVVGCSLGVVLMFYCMRVDDDALILIVPPAVIAGSTLILLANLLVLRAMRYRVVWAKP